MPAPRPIWIAALLIDDQRDLCPAAASCHHAATAQLSALGEKERELAAARQRANTLEAELADLERECALRQAQEQVGGLRESGWELA